MSSEQDSRSSSYDDVREFPDARNTSYDDVTEFPGKNAI